MTLPVCDPAVEAVLKLRAEQLAKLTAASDASEEIEVIVCRLGTEHYAVESRHLRAVQWANGITPVPCTPSYVIGIVSVRGEIVTLLDLAAMIGLTSAPAATSNSLARPVLLLGLAGQRSGLVVDEVLGVQRLKLDRLQPSLSGREFARGVGPDNTVLLDLEHLFGGGRFNISDEV
ncbi:MAG TPA: chemotaxis protein CheW [Chloroflexota bacterium]|nr:chemotaxis protein CheW [Chloroflexota bacterium]